MLFAGVREATEGTDGAERNVRGLHGNIRRSPPRIICALADKKARPIGRNRSPLRALASRGAKEPAPESDGGAEGKRS